MFRTLLILLFSSCAFAQAPGATSSSRRIALVIDNSVYEHLPVLSAPPKEAALIGDALSKAGFEIHRVTDFRMPAFLTQIRKEFTDAVKSGDICVVYFSGYAVQGEDDNYLLPVNFDPASSDELQDRAYHVNKIQDLVDPKNAALKIYIVEGARALDRPSTGIAGPGLREPELRFSNSTLFAFSTYLGQTTPVSAAPGLFTEAVAQNLNADGKRVVEVFESAKAQVGSASGSQQVPYVVNNILMQDFYFHAPKVVPPPPPAPQERQTGFSAVSKKDRLEYVFIKAGRFKEGCVPADSRCDVSESPQHTVTLTRNFWMGQTEVEVGAYRDRYMPSQGKKVRPPPKPGWSLTTNQPIVNITWEEAGNYCAWAGGRLPTEAEWEYVARAGADDQIYPLNNEDSRDKANFAGKKGNDIFDYVAPVKSFDPNAFKLFDLAGNVWEWVHDYYSPDYYGNSPATNPEGPTQGKDHVARGGSFDSDPKVHLRLSYRHHYGNAGNTVGFRCVLEDTAESLQLLGLPVAEGTSQRTAGTGQLNPVK